MAEKQRASGHSGTHDLHPPQWVRILFFVLAGPILAIAYLSIFTATILQAVIGNRAGGGPIDYVADAPGRAAAPIFIVGVIVLAALLSYCAIFLFGRHARRQQARRNREATGVGAQPQGAFVLYLRPFAEDRRTFVQNELDDVGRFMYGMLIPLEVSLSLHLYPRRKLVAIGDKFSSIGADKISVDDANWFEMVITLAKQADAIIMLPGYRGGTAREIDFLFSSPDLLSKTIFIQPACASDDQQWRDWQAYLKAAQSRGIELPPAIASGQIFFKARDGKTALLPLSRFNKKTINMLVEKAASGAIDWSEIDAARLRVTAKGKVLDDASPSGASWLANALGPRVVVAAMIILLGAGVSVAGQLMNRRQAEIEAQRAVSPLMAAYFDCAAGKWNPYTIAEDKRACRAHAEASGMARLVELGAAKLAQKDPEGAEAVYRQAFALQGPHLPGDKDAALARLTDAQAIDGLLTLGLSVVFPLDRITPPSPGARRPGADLNDNDPEYRRFSTGGERYPVLREFVEERDAIRFLFADRLNNATAPESREGTARRAQTLQEIYARLGRGYELAGKPDRALSADRKRLLVILAASSAPMDARGLSKDLSEAMTGLGRYPSAGIDWNRVADQIERTREANSFGPSTDALVAQARAMAPQPPTPPAPTDIGAETP